MTAKERLDEMKQFIRIAEGSWELPRTQEDFDALAAIINGNQTNFEIQKAIYNVLGDDTLFDRLDKLDPQEYDAPEVIIQWMQDQRKDKYSNFPNIWNTYKLSQRPDEGKSEIVKPASETQSKEATDLPMAEDNDPGDDAEWDAHWAREDDDDERADDLEADADTGTERVTYLYVYTDRLGNRINISVAYNPQANLPKIQLYNDDRMLYSISNIMFMRSGGSQQQTNIFIDAIYNISFDDNGPMIPSSLEVLDVIRDVTKLGSDIKEVQKENELDEVGDVAFDDYGAQPAMVEDDDPDSMGSYDIIWNDDTWKEAIPYDAAEKEVKHILQIIDDSALQAHDNNDHLKVKKTAKGDTMIWTVLDPIDGDYQEIRVEPSDMPAGYTGESVELDGIVEAILKEFPSQPKDYYDDEEFEQRQAERAKHLQAQAKEFAQDEIDPEIEDEELGLRFD